MFFKFQIVLGSNSDEKELSFKGYQTEDKEFHQLHETIIRKQSNKFSPLSGQPNYGESLSLLCILLLSIQYFRIKVSFVR
jgi:hypothetical protein